MSVGGRGGQLSSHGKNYGFDTLGRRAYITARQIRSFVPHGRFGDIMGFFKIITVAFLLFLAPADGSNPAGQSLTLT